MLHNRLIPIFLYVILLISTACSTQKAKSSEELTQSPKSVTMDGKIVIKAFVNKVGEKSQTMQDLYFESSKGTYFIKFMDSTISEAEAMSALNKPIKIEGEIREGLWDVPDDNPQFAQSRTGFYLIITKVIN